jgi:hypothetical protein
MPPRRSKMRQRRLSYRIDVEADVEAAAVVEDVAAVEDEGGFDHAVEDLVEIKVPVDLPLGQDGDRVAALRGLDGIFDVTDPALQSGEVDAGILEGLRHRPVPRSAAWR